MRHLITLSIMFFAGLLVGVSSSEAVLQPGDIITVAGGGSGLEDPAYLDSPYGVARDSIGNVYIADFGNNRIRKLDTYGNVTTVAGNGSAVYSGDGGPATEASVYTKAIAVDSDGNLYITGYERISKIDGSSGIITTVAGTGTSGFSGDGGAATSATLYNPQDVCVDSAGNIYISDAGNHRIRKVDTNGIITTVAGTGTAGYSGDGGAATSANVNAPTGISVDSSGNLYIADLYNHRIRKVDTNGIITTVAGNGTAGYTGDGGAATSASLYYPKCIRVDSTGNLFFIDYVNLRIRRVDTNGIITTVAGNGTAGYTGDGGSATSASINYPIGIDIDSAGKIYIADTKNFRIRLVDATGNISTIAGTGEFFSGDNGLATLARLNLPGSISVDSAGTIYFADSGNNRIRKVATNGIISTVAGDGSPGYSVDGTSAKAASITNPSGITFDQSGNLYFVDGYRVRKIDTNGIITTVAGNGTFGFSGDGGPALSAALWSRSIAIDSSGNLYLSDFIHNRIRRVDTNGIITTIAGNGTYAYSGEGVAATSASLNPSGISFDSSGNLYVADYGNNRIRKIDTSGIITTVAGTGSAGFSGEGGAAVTAMLYSPAGVSIDRDGNVYFADLYNDRIRKIDTSGVITTVAGGRHGFCGDGGPATAACFNQPSNVAFDGAGNIYISDGYNRRIRKVFTSNPTAADITYTPSGPYTLGSEVTITAAFTDQMPAAQAPNIALSGANTLAPSSMTRIDATHYSYTHITGVGSGSVSVTLYGVDQNGVAISPTPASGDNFLVGVPPSSPRATAASAFTASGFTANWQPSSGATGYRLDIATDSAFTAVVSGYDNLDVGNVTSFVATGLPANTIYFYRVRAYNAAGESSPSNTISQLSPPAPVAIEATGITKTGFTANWVVSSNAGGYLLDVSTDSGFAQFDGGFSGLDVLNTHSFAVVGLMPNTTYYYRVRAYNVIGSSVNSDSVSLTTGAPAPGDIITVAGNGISGFTGDDGLATAAALYYPHGIGIDTLDNLYITTSNRIRKVDNSGRISTVIGNNPGFSGDNGYALYATLNNPDGVMFDEAGNLYIADAGNHRIRKVFTNGVITTIAGNGSAGFGGDGGLATSANLQSPSGSSADSSGNVYIADTDNHRIRMIDATGKITTVAGNGTAGYAGDGASAKTASLNRPEDVRVDNAGNIYIADSYNHRIRKVAPDGIITTIAGNGAAGYSGDGGPATAAQLNYPASIALDSCGSLYITSGNSYVRKVDANGIISTVAGTGIAGFSGDGGPAIDASLNGATFLALDRFDNFYIADSGNYRIRKVFRSSPTATVTYAPEGPYLPGNVITITATYDAQMADSPVPTISLSGANILAPAAMSRIDATHYSYSYIAGPGLGEVTVSLAGSDLNGFAMNATPSSGAQFTVGPLLPVPPTASAATLVTSDGFTANWQVTSGATGYLLDVAADSAFTSFVAGLDAFDTGSATSYAVSGLSAGTTYYYRLRAYNTDGSGGYSNAISQQTTPDALPQQPVALTADSVTKTGFSANWEAPIGAAGYKLDIATDSAFIDLVTGFVGIDVGNVTRYAVGGLSPGTDYFYRIRAYNGFGTGASSNSISLTTMTLQPGDIFTVAGSGTSGFTGDGGPAVLARMSYPAGVCIDSVGNIYFSDSSNRRIRMVDTSGIIATIAGNGTLGFSGDGGPAIDAIIGNAAGMSVDSSGNLYFADSSNNRIRRIDTAGIITTVAGNGTAGFSGDGGAATSAALKSPGDVSVDSTGNLFIADSGNYRIRKIASDGTITTVAGNGGAGFSGDGGAATAAGLRADRVAVDSLGTVFIVDSSNHRIRKVDAGGIITTVAGNGSSGFSGDNVLATDASLKSPSDVSVDSAGNIYIVDGANRRIRRVAGNGIITTIAGTGVSGFSGDNGPAVAAQIANSSATISIDRAGNLYLADYYNRRIRKILKASPTTATVSYEPSYPIYPGSIVSITATFADVMLDSPVPTIALSGADMLSPTAMTKIDATHYRYDYMVGQVLGTVAVSLGGTDQYSNALHPVPSSGASFVVVQQPPPAAPVISAATDVSTSGFTANWQSVPGADGYRIDVATDSGFTGFVSGYNDIDAGSATSHAVSGLSAGTNYYYRIRAYNGEGTSTSSEAMQTTNVQLSVKFGGSGSGSVTASASDYANTGCDKAIPGSCTATDYLPGTVVSLIATPDWKSSFASWTQVDSSAGATASVTMNTSKTVTATFDPIYTVKMMPSGVYYASVQDAYDNASGSGAAIMAQDQTFFESLLLNNASVTDITLDGGQNPTYSAPVGYTIFQGLTIRNGKVVVRNIKLKQ